MTTRLRGWREIENHLPTGERWYGRGHIRSYTGDDLFRSPELTWFRDAVQDVRQSMGLACGELLVQELHVYEELVAAPAPTSSGVVSWIRSRVAPKLKKRRGMVCYADAPAPSRLYLSREGRDTPRIVYEEVAHSLLRPLPVESSDRRPDDLQAYIRSLLRSNPLCPPPVVYWPIACHLDIFRGFLNESDAYRHSTEEDRQFVRTQVARLEGVLRCRRLMSGGRRACPCRS